MLVNLKNEVKRMPHAGIEPATFCLLDRRSAPEPMRLKMGDIYLTTIQN